MAVVVAVGVESSVGEGARVGSVGSIVGLGVDVSGGGVSVADGRSGEVEVAGSVGYGSSTVLVEVAVHEAVASGTVAVDNGSARWVEGGVRNSGSRSPAARKPAAGRANRVTWAISIPLRPSGHSYYCRKLAASQQAIRRLRATRPVSPARVMLGEEDGCWVRGRWLTRRCSLHAPGVHHRQDREQQRHRSRQPHPYRDLLSGAAIDQARPAIGQEDGRKARPQEDSQDHA